MMSLIYKRIRKLMSVSIPVITLLCCFLIVAGSHAFSQEAKTISIKGNVTSQAGELLNGVTIFIKGSNKGVTTQQDGYFQLEAPAGSTIVISYIGYISKEIKNRQQ